MVIQPNTDLTNASQARQKAASSATASPSDASSSTAKNTEVAAEKNVQLSSQAQTIEKLEAKILSSEGVDSAKVEEIKQQIADGSYEMNSSNIADKLLAQENLMS
ncbi:Negative regulator of flagellin synthesis flgM [gamma proteobacterium IMCC1989]|nr:Negative regulator of flagellin synthesis flgM [gamma proteobacterium IMCC1989]